MNLKVRYMSLSYALCRLGNASVVVVSDRRVVLGREDTHVLVADEPQAEDVESRILKVEVDTGIQDVAVDETFLLLQRCVSDCTASKTQNARMVEGGWQFTATWLVQARAEAIIERLTLFLSSLHA